MKTIKTSEAEGIVLDYLVMIAQYPNNSVEFFLAMYSRGGFDYSTCWEIGGPIIERELIEIKPVHAGWAAFLGNGCYKVATNPLVAAMRCYVASKLGDEVEVPDELFN